MGLEKISSNELLIGFFNHEPWTSFLSTKRNRTAFFQAIINKPTKDTDQKATFDNFKQKHEPKT